MGGGQESPTRKQIPIKRVLLVLALIALAIFLLIETLSTTVEVESSLGPIFTSV